jgi:hypothetical protein
MTCLTGNELMITVFKNEIGSFEAIKIDMARVALLSIDLPAIYNL